MDEITYKLRRYTKFGNYYRSSRKFLHRAVWEDAHGPIPAGFHIHHKDGNRDNNSIENLEAVDGSDHLSAHHKGHTRRPDEAIAAQAIWRETAEGKSFLAEMGRRNHHYMRNDGQFVCQCCGKKFVAQITGGNRFCSAKCKAKQRRIDGTDLVPATCKVCEKEFMADRFRPQKTCSRSCGRKLWLSTTEGVAHLERLASAKRRKE